MVLEHTPAGQSMAQGSMTAIRDTQLVGTMVASEHPCRGVQHVGLLQCSKFSNAREFWLQHSLCQIAHRRPDERAAPDAGCTTSALQSRSPQGAAVLMRCVSVQMVFKAHEGAVHAMQLCQLSSGSATSGPLCLVTSGDHRN